MTRSVGLVEWQLKLRHSNPPLRDNLVSSVCPEYRSMEHMT